MSFSKRITTEAVGVALLITGGVAVGVAQAPEIFACEDASGNDMTETTKTEAATLVHCDSQYMSSAGNTVHDFAKGIAIATGLGGLSLVFVSRRRPSA